MQSTAKCLTFASTTISIGTWSETYTNALPHARRNAPDNNMEVPNYSYNMGIPEHFSASAGDALLKEELVHERAKARPKLGQKDRAQAIGAQPRALELNLESRDGFRVVMY